MRDSTSRLLYQENFIARAAVGVGSNVHEWRAQRDRRGLLSPRRGDDNPRRLPDAPASEVFFRENLNDESLSSAQRFLNLVLRPVDDLGRSKLTASDFFT